MLGEEREENEHNPSFEEGCVQDTSDDVETTVIDGIKIVNSLLSKLTKAQTLLISLFCCYCEVFERQ